MEINRKSIYNFFNESFENTQYCKKYKNVNYIKDFENISLKDLDFIAVIKEFAGLLKSAFNSLPYVKDWKPSGRQQFVTISLNQKIGDIMSGEYIEKKSRLVRLYEDSYWDIFDYFYDYGNPNPIVNKMEVESILAVIENFLIACKNQIW